MSTSGGPNGDGTHPCDGWGIQEYEIERLRLLTEGARLEGVAVGKLNMIAARDESIRQLTVEVRVLRNGLCEIARAALASGMDTVGTDDIRDLAANTLRDANNTSASSSRESPDA